LFFPPVEGFFFSLDQRAEYPGEQTDCQTSSSVVSLLMTPLVPAFSLGLRLAYLDDCGNYTRHLLLSDTTLATISAGLSCLGYRTPLGFLFAKLRWHYPSAYFALALRPRLRYPVALICETFNRYPAHLCRSGKCAYR
jgi:hypothetical protein